MTSHETKEHASEDCARWVDEHGDYLFRYALRRVRLLGIAEDLVQDTFLAALRHHQQFAGRSTERSWLCAILKNKIIHHYRKLGQEKLFTDLEVSRDDSSKKFVAEGWWVHATAPKKWNSQPDAVVDRSEFWSTMDACLGKLPDRIANVFIMRETDGISTKKICEMLSISENNVWVMLHRARTSLRECLEKNWFQKGAK
jgi:RNA polymerase sigma-70 factor (TIGR02943 family)